MSPLLSLFQAVTHYNGIKNLSIFQNSNVLEHVIFIWKTEKLSAWWKKDGIWLPCSFSNASVLPVCAGHCCNVSNTV